MSIKLKNTNAWNIMSISYFLVLSVRVIPWPDTLKWTGTAAGKGFLVNVSVRAFLIAWGPVKDSISTAFRYNTLHARTKKKKGSLFDKLCNKWLIKLY